MANHYNNHRTVVSSGPSNRLGELLEALKGELDNLNQDSSVFKMQREEYEHKIVNAQIAEMQAFQQNIYELERNHQKIKQQYEEEIMRLRRELDQRSGHIPGGPTPGHPQMPPPNIGPGSSNLFNSMAGAPPQLVDPSQTHHPSHPSFPPPSSNPSGPNHYHNGAPPGSQPPPLSHLPPHTPGAPGMLNKRTRGEPEGYPINPNMPPSSHHMPPGMHPGHMSNSGMPGKLPSMSQSQLGPPVPGDSHPPHLMGGPPMSGLPPNSSAASASIKRKNGGPLDSGPAGSGPSAPSSVPPRASIKQSPALGTPHGASQPPLPGMSEMDPENVPAHHKQEGNDWFAIFNPKVPRVLNVELVSTLDHNSVVCCVRFSYDGKYLATGCNRTAQIYDATTSQKICVLADDSVNKNDDLYIRSVCFSPDGKYLATGAEDKLIRIWDIKRKIIVHLFQGHEQDIYSLDFSRDGRFIVSGSGDRTARLWDMESRKCLFTLTIDDMSAKDAGVTSVALSPDGRLVAAGSLDKLVRVWDSHSGQLIDKLEGHKDSVYSVAFSSDGKTLTSGSLDKTLKLWDLSTLGQKTGVLCRSTFVGHKDFVLSVACSPCGNWLVSGSKDRGVQFWDPRTSQTQFMLQGHKNSVISVAVSPAGRLFATGSGDCRARLWIYDNTPSGMSK